MNDNRSQFTRRKFLLHASALSPFVALLALKGRLFGDIALAQSATPAATSVMLDCIASPEMTEGPYFVDELLNRIDIRTDPTNNSVKPGAPLNLAISVFSVDGSTCTPLKNAQIDIWQCDAGGRYSDESANNTVGQKFLRGYQVTDETGLVNFTTIYPGWYMGRTIHIHMKVRTYPEGAISPNGLATPSALATQSPATYLFNSQLFFDDALSDEVMAQPPYNTRGKRTTTNANDGIFNGNMGGTDADDVGERMLVTLTKEGDTYVGKVNIGVDLSKPSSQGLGGPGGPGGPGRP